jgi:hypothetical protein
MSDYPARSPLQLGWLIVAFGLVAVLTVGGGWLAWRGLSNTTPTTTAATPALSGEPTSVAFGAPEVIDGIPWGFPPTLEGAAAAASTAVSVTGQAQAVFDADRFEQVAAVVFTDTEAAAQVREVDAARVQFEISGWADQPASRRMYHFAPLAIRPVAFDAEGGEASIEVWAMTLVGVGDRGGAVFTTSTVDLALSEAGTWQVTALDSEAGPTPMVEDTPTVPGRTRALTRDTLPGVLLPLTVAGP